MSTAISPAKSARRDVSGWVILDKPCGLTSAQAVARLRRLYLARKAGHAGTLDPLASGILPVALGEATKSAGLLTAAAKTYRFTLCWGIGTDTHDRQGQVTERSPRRPAAEDVRAALRRFTGAIMQIPPAYSAVKSGGRRAYALARAGRPPALAPRPVEIHAARLLPGAEPGQSRIEISCSKGTYVRALARDLAAALAIPAHVGALRRTRLGPFGESDMIGLDKLDSFGHSPARRLARLDALRVPIRLALAGLPAMSVGPQDAMRLRCGQALPAPDRDPAQGGALLVLQAGKPVALARVQGCALRPNRVFGPGAL